MKIQLLLPVLLLALISTSCTYESGDTPSPAPMLSSATVWSGPTISFEKDDDANPNQAENQDRITEKVWITRGNNGGQIYNAVLESNSSKSSSPSGTQWAVGTTEDLPNLEFDDFRAAIGKPKSAVGKNLVLLLEEENIAIDIKFTKRSGNKQGGFAYERSSN